MSAGRPHRGQIKERKLEERVAERRLTRILSPTVHLSCGKTARERTKRVIGHRLAILEHAETDGDNEKQNGGTARRKVEDSEGKRGGIEESEEGTARGNADAKSELGPLGRAEATRKENNTRAKKRKRGGWRAEPGVVR